ncbi:NAD(P)(+) transhydrogenase (Re/Si-specific) subunit beta [bacterium]|nr:NAD(P)(+) transhydrogenase (Re/Si-specific) subunit beta [bacterium]
MIQLPSFVTNLGYLVAIAFFIMGIKKLGRVKTAQAGNRSAAWGMLLAVLLTVPLLTEVTWMEVLIALAVGSLIGGVAAKRVEMTGMPELVALFNGFGGLASVLVALGFFFQSYKGAFVENLGGAGGVGVVFLTVLIGSVTLTGSYIAYAKLHGVKIGGFKLSNPVTFKGQQLLNGILFLSLVALPILASMGVIDPRLAVYLFTGLALLLGKLVVIPIGGADMPVVVALLNSYSGMAAAAAGFILLMDGNVGGTILIVSGALVGASGLILTNIMCVAMNRSLLSVMLGGFGQEGGEAVAGDGPAITYKPVGSEEAAMIFEAAERVVVVPGYGMAVAQAQHNVRELMEELQGMGVQVQFAIHPVAGRMPGHMNVLLAEANVPYELLIEMDEINPQFNETDVVLVIGANDVVNPAAETDPNSPIAGMPVLQVWKATTVIVNKRGRGVGYAGIENALFGQDNTLMLFGDGKQMMIELTNELKEL